MNLILSILVFQERKYCLHDNVKLVFFKKKNIQKLYTLYKKKHPNSASKLHCSKYTKTIHTFKKKKNPNSASEFALFACTVQMNYTVHANAKFKKAARSCFVM